MHECAKVSRRRKFFKRPGFPDGFVALDVIEHRGGQNEESTIDAAIITKRLFSKGHHFFASNLKRAESCRWADSSQRSAASGLSVEVYQTCDINIPDTVAICHTKILAVIQ